MAATKLISRRTLQSTFNKALRQRPTTSTSTTTHQTRPLHNRMPQSSTPKPTPFVPDTPTFLTLIGRQLSQHASKIPSWSALFNLTSRQLKDLGIEPARSRRYLLRWRDKFRRGDWGVGGDLRFVDENGVGLVGVVDVPIPPPESVEAGTAEQEAANPVQKPPRATITRPPGTNRIIVSLPPATPASAMPPVLRPSPPGPTTVPAESDSAQQAPVQELPGADRARPVAFLKLQGSSQIYGPHVELVSGSAGTMGRIRVKEGLWEDRRGQKVDGGERRRAEVRAKKAAAERAAA